MPKITGLEVLKRIKQIRPNQIVIIFSSGSDPNSKFESQVKEMGAFDCLYKPVDLENILKIINRALGGE